MRKRRYSVLKSDAGSSSPRFLCAVQLLHSKGSGRHFSGTLPVRVADESLRHPWLPTRLGAGTRLPIIPPLYSCLHSSLRASVASLPALPLVVSVGRSHKTTMVSPKVPPVTHPLLFIISGIAAGTALFQDAVLNPVSYFHFTRQHPPCPRPAPRESCAGSARETGQGPPGKTTGHRSSVQHHRQRHIIRKTI